MILVDTSAWIDFFRGRAPFAAAVDRLLESNEVALCGPVVTELRRGLRTARDRARVLPLIAGCHALEQPDRLWDEAGDLGYALARRGTSVKTVDLLIATYAIAHGVPLLAIDGDFAMMKRGGLDLILVEP
ncbi:MAG TPA: PIN domain-containing protein [Candidatus Binatia bacterium]